MHDTGFRIEHRCKPSALRERNQRAIRCDREFSPSRDSGSIVPPANRSIATTNCNNVSAITNHDVADARCDIRVCPPKFTNSYVGYLSSPKACQ